MKPLVIALVLSTAAFSFPAVAQNIDASNVTRSLSFPDPAPKPEPEDKSQIKK
ncbi:MULTISPECIES: hypothetical protein [unclassified Ruegeria]|uniref:hypothetical protein n=1 Tax=unclassified Ruegeria TaxID=2625375 RepID=UPI001487C5CC|nr:MULTISPECIES: hypothetical protein [unclassified Ruegeria]